MGTLTGGRQVRGGGLGAERGSRDGRLLRGPCGTSRQPVAIPATAGSHPVPLGHGQRMAFGPTEPQRGPGAGYRPRIAPYGPQKAPSPVPCDAKRAICMSPFRSERMGPGGHWPKGGLAPLLVGLGCCGHIMAHLGPCRPNLGHLEPASSGQRPEPPGRWGPKPCQLDALTQGCLSIDVEARVGSQAPA